MEVIVIRLVPHKEYDVIVTSITTDGFYSFKAKGLLRPTAKLSSIITIGNLINIETIDAKGGPLVVGAKPLLNMSKLLSNFDKLTVLNYLAELTRLIIKENDEARSIYPFFKSALSYIEEDKSPLVIATIFSLHLLNICGYEQNFASCQTCGSLKNLAAINIKEGGLFCVNCKKLIDIELDEVNVNALYNIFVKKESDWFSNKFNEDQMAPILRTIIEFLSDVFSLTFQSLPLLKLSFNL
ncbi:MAG: DNA repair protein RecO [Erysipelotrichaceae bacterium]|nr:DNA repair protein RecO [Erysipelotrichaceae bacterium]